MAKNMKKETIAGLIAIIAIALVAIFAGCIEPTPTPPPQQAPTFTPSVTPTPTTNGIFALKSWKAIDDEGRAKLLLKINLTDDIFMVLLNPDGDVVGPTGHTIIGSFGGVTEISLDQKYYTEVSVANTFMPNHRQKIIRMPIKTDYHDYS